MATRPGRSGFDTTEPFADIEMLQNLFQTRTSSTGNVTISSPSPLTMFVAQRLNALVWLTNWVTNEAINILQATVYNLPITLFASGLALGINEIARNYSPRLIASTESSLAGSYKVAIFVGTTFLVKAALDPFVNTAIPIRKGIQKAKEKAIYNTFVEYTCPLVTTLIAAYIYGIKINPTGLKMVEAAVGTTAIFTFTHFLERGLRYSLNTHYISWVVDKLYG